MASVLFRPKVVENPPARQGKPAALVPGPQPVPALSAQLVPLDSAASLHKSALPTPHLAQRGPLRWGVGGLISLVSQNLHRESPRKFPGSFPRGVPSRPEAAVLAGAAGFPPSHWRMGRRPRPELPTAPIPSSPPPFRRAVGQSGLDSAAAPTILPRVGSLGWWVGALLS